MNKERLLILADVIEKLEHCRADNGFTDGPLAVFNMGVWRCGSAGCIGGWAESLWRDGMRRADVDEVEATGPLLGLDPYQAYHLFYPQSEDGYDLDHTGSYGDITPAQAAATIRHFVRYGIIDWQTPVLPVIPFNAGHPDAMVRPIAAQTADEVVKKLEKAGWKVEELELEGA